MDSQQVSKTEFKAKALEIFRQVEATGDTVIVTDKGRPAIEVRRARADKRSPLERLQGTVIEYQDPTEPVGAGDWNALK
jgi:prevent-host-death family protein